MVNEPLNIEDIQRKIAEYQKKMRYNYSMLQNDELEDQQRSRVVNETNELKEMVVSLQNRLKELYREMFTGSKKELVRIVLDD